MCRPSFRTRKLTVSEIWEAGKSLDSIIILLRQPYLSNHSSYSYDLWINPLQILPTTIFVLVNPRKSRCKKETLQSLEVEDADESEIESYPVDGLVNLKSPS